MILSGTGHRPDKLTRAAYALKLSGTTQTLEEKLDFLVGGLLQPKRIKSGMALGFDMMLARCAVKYSIPFDAYVPFKGQERLWAPASQREYHELLAAAASVFIVSEGDYAAAKMHKRNEKLVDDCTSLLACYDGTPGGTFSTVKYALEVRRHTLRLNPSTLELEEWCKS